MTNWNYVKFKEGTWGDVRIHTEDNQQYLSEDEWDEYGKWTYHWMGTGPSYIFGLLGQRLMFHKAKGKVLTTLGLGLLPLLMATKDEVTEVVCYETNKDIIKAWDEQDFDKSKITVVNDSVINIDSIDSYDSIFFDCGDVMFEFVDKWNDTLRDHNFVMQAWEDNCINHLSKHYRGAYSLEAVNEYLDTLCMNPLTQEEADTALFTYWGRLQKIKRQLDSNDNEEIQRATIKDYWPIDSAINQQLLKIK